MSLSKHLKQVRHVILAEVKRTRCLAPRQFSNVLRHPLQPERPTPPCRSGSGCCRLEIEGTFLCVCLQLRAFGKKGLINRDGRPNNCRRSQDRLRSFLPRKKRLLQGWRGAWAPATVCSLIPARWHPGAAPAGALPPPTMPFTIARIIALQEVPDGR